MRTASPTPAATGSPPSSGFTNPVYPNNFPDPMIIDGGDDRWWAYATNGNGANVQTLRSPDLLNWEQAPDALPQLPSWTTPGDVWAPEVAATDGRWLLYYTTHAPGGDVQCISVAVADAPGGPFTDSSRRPLVCEREAGGSIDPHPFRAADGTRYLYWKNDGNRVGVDTWISVQRLDAGGQRLVGRPRKLIKQDQPWEGRLVEAPFVWQQGSTFWLFYSANAYDSTDYAVGVARASAPDGPFRKISDPVLRSTEAAAGPGHCALLAKDGQVWMAYHAWAPDAIGSDPPGRMLWLSRVAITGDSVEVEPPTVDQVGRP